MKRRTLDVLFSAGGAVLAGLLLVAGIVLSANANFANTYVRDQLSQQNITFKTVNTLTAEEKQQSCLVTYAGQQLTTGPQAECYANHFIALHLKSVGGGKTYAELGAPQTDLANRVAAAKKNNDPNLADLQKQYNDISTARDTVFKGETLRGLLLTSFGFSEFGRKAGQAAVVAYLAAILMALMSIAGFIHAFVTPRSRAIGVPGPQAVTSSGKALAGV